MNNKIFLKLKSYSTYIVSFLIITILSACGGGKNSKPNAGVLQDKKLLSCFPQPPTKDELLKVRKFSCKDIDLSTSNLYELNNLPSLKILNLNNTKLSNLEPLSKLTNLTQLVLQANNTDEFGTSKEALEISPLATLKNLESLDLSNNCITDLTPISNLTNLKELSLNQINKGPGCSIIDLQPLSVLTKLKTLNLENNKLSAGFGYISAFIDKEGLFDYVDLSMLSTLVNLEYLNLSRSIFSGFNEYSSGIPNFPKLISLDLSKNGGGSGSGGFDSSLTLKNLTSISKLTTLETLDLHSNSLDDISPVASLTQLSYLDLHDNVSVNDIWYPGSTEKRIFQILQHLESLSSLTKLKYLDLSYTGIDSSDIEILATLTNLTSLMLDSNYLRDSDVINFPILENLKTLSLSTNLLTTVEFLSGLSLKYLDLSHNCIEDFSSLQADILVTDNQSSECY